MTNNGVFVSEILRGLLSFQIYDVTNSLGAKINHKIKNISENIRVVLLKLGTSNVPPGRHKMTPTVATILLSGLFHARLAFSYFVLVRHRAIWAFRAFQVGLSASPYLLKNGDILFIIERDWGRM